MPLSIDIGGVEGIKEKMTSMPVWIEATPTTGQHMHPRVFSLGVMLMCVNYGPEITDETIPEILTRASIFERLFGAFYTDGQGEPEPVTQALLQEWRGLKINAPAPEDRKRWLGRMFESHARDLGVGDRVARSTSPLDELCSEEARMPIMTHVYELMIDRGVVSRDVLEEGLDTDMIDDHYCTYVGPAMDRLQRALRYERALTSREA